MHPRCTQCAAALALFCLAGAAVTTMSCNRESNSPFVKFGERQNAERRRLGLPIADPTWRRASLDSQSYVWSSPQGGRRGVPSYFDKLLTVDGQTLVEEVDFYTNGKWVTTPSSAGAPVTAALVDVPDMGALTNTSQGPGTPGDGRLTSLVIHFSYERSARGMDPWSCALTEGATDREMTLPEAETLLASWGLKRLNY